MVVAVRAVLVATPHQSERDLQHSLIYSRVLELARIFPEGLCALFAYKDHVKRLHERMVALFLMTFCAVEPFFAYPFFSAFGHVFACWRRRTARRADGDLGVEDVFAGCASAWLRR